MAKRKILITGGAGFIGSNLIDELISNTEYEIVCVDNFDDYYPAEIKMSNLEGALQSGRVHLIREDICRLGARKELDGVEMIVHLAAKAGVRPSIQNPGEYVRVNVLGTQNLLELAREMEVKHFVFGSSSSVYGVNPNYPWVESDNVLQPISPYAATKISGELLGSVYAN
ncbi:GDP-mannose 4,6-dehydratase, partial [Candidatus Dojkabacteria bacterium]|nr:GDP-mannose 4,6-dehydratase [Candidatus Dojkabacteria bacterium]